ncbi:uncharacterized protein LOC143463524 isoform X2 [Clavelina lepadiformis]|uniref:uncharacterized protein LOC143463524 isoform X2 n=1 Tax=Clavelina lepadiformis TaxID=159417 RepID=UPI00404113D5
MKHSREWLLFMAGLITSFGCILLWTGFAMIPVPHQIGPNMQGFEKAMQNREKVTQSKINIKLTNEVLSKTRLAVERDADLIKTKHRTYNSRTNSSSKGNRSSHKKANSYQNASKFYNNVKKNTGTKNATNGVLSAKHSSRMVFNASKKLICSILVWVDNEKRMDEEWPAEGLELPGKCQITYRHKALHTADIVVIHQRNLNGTLPWKHTRYDHQIFVWWSDQNPWYIKYISNQSLTEYNNFFNWTMTYRRDSDVYFPLWRKSSLYSNLAGGRDNVRNVIDKKTKSAVWILNNCKQSIANKQRMRLAVQLVQGKLKLRRQLQLC